MKVFVGILIIITSLLNSILASNFKRINYIYGLICYVLMGLVSYQNHIYGMFFFYLFVFAPLQVYGFIKWGKNKDKSDKLVTRSFSPQTRIITLISCIFISLSLAFLLQLIPGARFTYLDAFSNIINLFGVILLALRFNESWWLWLINNVIDVILWNNVHHLSGAYSFSMLLSSAIYLIVNFYGIYKWNNKSKFLDIVKIEEKRQIITISYIINGISIISYFLVFNWIGLFVSIFDITISVIDSFKIKKKIIVSIIGWILLIILILLPLKRSWIDYFALLDLFLYSLIPLLKNTNHIRLIGFINIFLFMIFDGYYKLYNLLLLDIFVFALFFFHFFVSKKEDKKIGVF